MVAVPVKEWEEVQEGDVLIVTERLGEAVTVAEGEGDGDPDGVRDPDRVIVKVPVPVMVRVEDSVTLAVLEIDNVADAVVESLKVAVAVDDGGKVTVGDEEAVNVRDTDAERVTVRDWLSEPDIDGESEWDAVILVDAGDFVGVIDNVGVKDGVALAVPSASTRMDTPMSVSNTKGRINTSRILNRRGKLWPSRLKYDTFDIGIRWR